MITKDEARTLEFAELSKTWGIEDDEPVIIDEHTIERAFGWVFFYDSLRHQQTQSLGDSLAGNAPVIVNRFDGLLHYPGTALPTEEYIRAYEVRLADEQGHEALHLHRET